MQDTETKIQAARQSAIDDEVRHIVEELEPRAAELARQWLKQEDRLRQQELQEAEIERRREETTLEGLLRDARGKLEKERQNKEEVRLKTEAQELERAEEERRRLTHEPATPGVAPEGFGASPPKRKSKKDDDAVWGPAEAAQATEADEKEKKVRSLISRAGQLLSLNDVKGAAVEVEEALGLDPSNAEALSLQQKIGTMPQRVEAVAEKAEEKKEVQPEVQRKPAPKKTGRVVLIAGAAVLVIGAAVAYFQFRNTLFPKTYAVAVLPFTSADNSQDEVVLGSSLSEEVVGRLQHLKFVNVLGFSSALALARSHTDPLHSLFELGYPSVLKGSVKYADGKYTLDAILTDSLGATQWSHSFEKSQDQLAQLPGEVASSIVQFLGIAVDGKSSSMMTQTATANGNAYLSYLRGLEILHHGDAESAQKALEYFQQSVDLDKDFVAVLAEAALSIAARAERLGDTSKGVLGHAEELTQACLSSDGSNAAGHIALGRILALRRQYADAQREFDAALAQSPNSSDAYAAKAKVSLEVGKYDDAVEALTRASELNPRDPEMLELFAFANQLKNDPREAVRFHDLVLSLVSDTTQYLCGPIADAMLYDPEFILSYGDRVTAALERRISANPKDYVSMYRLARYYQLSGKPLEATKTLDKVQNVLRTELRARPQNADATAYLGLVLTRIGKYSEAESFAKKAADMADKNSDVLYRVSQVYSLQKKPEALTTLRQAVAMRFNLAEVTNADFYNSRDNQDFYAAIQLPLR